MSYRDKIDENYFDEGNTKVYVTRTIGNAELENPVLSDKEISGLRWSASIKDNGEYLISWDKYVIDTPVLDFVYFYKKEWGSLEFTQLFESYDNIFHII